jgi:hypothetical protein
VEDFSVSILVLAIGFAVILLLAGARIAWKFYRRHEEMKELLCPILLPEGSLLPANPLLLLAETDIEAPEEVSAPDSAPEPAGEKIPPEPA